MFLEELDGDGVVGIIHMKVVVRAGGQGNYICQHMCD